MSWCYGTLHTSILYRGLSTANSFKSFIRISIQDSEVWSSSFINFSKNQASLLIRPFSIVFGTLVCHLNHLSTLIPTITANSVIWYSYIILFVSTSTFSSYWSWSWMLRPQASKALKFIQHFYPYWYLTSILVKLDWHATIRLHLTHSLLQLALILILMSQVLVLSVW